MQHPLRKVLLFICFVVHGTASAQELTVNRLFNDHMVLQQNQPNRIWGTAGPGDTIAIHVAGHAVIATAGKDSTWHALIPSLESGGPFLLSVCSRETDLRFSDVLVGEVWFASGQSNMAMKVRRCNNAEEEIANSHYPEIRYFHVPPSMSNHPADSLDGGEWMLAGPATVGNFSGTAWFFAREIHTIRDVPVGIIEASWGGTPAESWTSYTMLEAFNEFEMHWNKQPAHVFRDAVRQNKADRARINEILNQESLGLDLGVHRIQYADMDWDRMHIPVHFHNTNISGYQGYAWFRKHLVLPGDWSDKNLQLVLGKIEQSDNTYINGTEIGHSYRTHKVRKYDIPPGVLVEGDNVIAVRVLHRRKTGGGFWQGPFRIIHKDTKEVLKELEGGWLYNTKIEPEFPRVTNFSHEPGVLFNAMVHPVIPYGIRGVIWYQGESNADRAAQYQRLFPALIRDWRIHWGMDYFPFLYVQLANFLEKDTIPSDDPWPYLREAQTMALELPATGMASAIDIGEAHDIHPKNKQEVGRRLALAARNIAYGEDILHSGPMMRDVYIDQSMVVLDYDYIGEGLRVKGDGDVTGFALAAADGVFHWAEAQLEGVERVVVWSEQVPKPVYVRYGWSNNPEINLYNSAGLPAVPFRTDRYQPQ